MFFYLNINIFFPLISGNYATSTCSEHVIVTPRVIAGKCKDKGFKEAFVTNLCMYSKMLQAYETFKKSFAS